MVFICANSAISAISAISAWYLISNDVKRIITAIVHHSSTKEIIAEYKDRFKYHSGSLLSQTDSYNWIWVCDRTWKNGKISDIYRSMDPNRIRNWIKSDFDTGKLIPENY